MKTFEVSASDGVAVPLSWFPADKPRWVLLMLPALGIQCRFYNNLAVALASEGCSVCLLEQRGHGRSALRASKTVNWGYDEFLYQDIPAALGWLEQQPENAGLPMIMSGHSLGGHLSTIYAGQHPDRLRGVVHIACGSPYFGDHSAATALGVKLACGILPVFRLLPGYFPGETLGFAGRESMTLMQDWSDWAGTGKLDYGKHQGLEAAVANFQGAVLAVSMAGDKLSSLPAEQRAIAPFSSARSIRQVRIGNDESGDHPGHFAWAKEPEGTANAVLQWLQDEIPGPNAVQAQATN